LEASKGVAMTTATTVGHVEMRSAKAVGLATAEDEPFYYVELEEVAGDRHLPWCAPLAGGSGRCGSTG
jgi:hypothetical protein